MADHNLIQNLSIAAQTISALDVKQIEQLNLQEVITLIGSANVCSNEQKEQLKWPIALLKRSYDFLKAKQPTIECQATNEVKNLRKDNQQLKQQIIRLRDREKELNAIGQSNLDKKDSQLKKSKARVQELEGSINTIHTETDRKLTFISRYIERASCWKCWAGGWEATTFALGILLTVIFTFITQWPVDPLKRSWSSLWALFICGIIAVVLIIIITCFRRNHIH